MQDTENISIEEAAVILHLQKATIWGWCRQGRLPGAFKMPGGKRWLVNRKALLEAEKKSRRDYAVTN